MGKLIDDRAVKKERPVKEKVPKTLEEYKKRIWSKMDIPEWLEKSRWIVNPANDHMKILNILKSTCWDSTKSRYVTISPNGSMNYFGKTDAHLILKNVTITVPDNEFFLMYTDDLDDIGANKTNWDPIAHRKRLEKLMLNLIIEKRQVDTFAVEVDPWGKEVKIIHDRDNREMTIILNKLIQKAPKKVIDDEVIADYKDHFPQIDTFIKLIAAFRFGADTKQSYLWIRATSDWGKSFLLDGILGEMGLTVFLKEKELKKAFSGDPVGLSGSMFVRAWMLFFEEFSGAVKELKDITHSMVLAPKNEPRIKVNIYGKVFLSAENVNSLEDSKGVESQFANRFMKLSLEGSLVKRPLFSGGKLRYLEAVRWYVYTKIQEEVAIYLSMDKYTAADRAESIQREFRKDHQITTEDMMENIQSGLENYYDEMQEKWGNSGYTIHDTKEDREIRSMFGVRDGMLYVVKPGKVKDHFLNHEFSKAEQANLHHKSPIELLMLGRRTRKRFGVATIEVNCYPILLKK